MSVQLINIHYVILMPMCEARRLDMVCIDVKTTFLESKVIVIFWIILLVGLRINDIKIKLNIYINCDNIICVNHILYEYNMQD